MLCDMKSMRSVESEEGREAELITLKLKEKAMLYTPQTFSQFVGLQQ